MTTRSRIAVFFLASLPALGYLPSIHASDLIPPKLATEAQVNESAARAQAFKAYPGNIQGMALERAAGGSGLRYTFEMEKAGEHRVVAVDAKTGSILENAPRADEHGSNG
ncbi:MAG: PepSY domain-containing protein [Betaproteobacteria bacterium]|nr:PepSY domain-containing protein [Betaproteobacteria bacterium]